MAHITLRWRPNHCDNLGDLIHVVLAREDGFSTKHLRQNTTGRPDVDLFGVISRENELWGAIPASDDVLCHLGLGGRIFSYKTRQAEVAQLQITVPVHQQVARLEVTVPDALGVHVRKARGDLADPLPQLGLCSVAGSHLTAERAAGQQLGDDGKGLATGRVAAFEC